jgi:hypothetical protein
MNNYLNNDSAAWHQADTFRFAKGLGMTDNFFGGVS